MTIRRLLYRGADVRFLYSGYLGVPGSYKHEGSVQRFGVCPYCRSPLHDLGVQFEKGHSWVSQAHPNCCPSCGFWEFSAYFDELADEYEHAVQVVAELARYNIADIHTPTRALGLHLNKSHEDIYYIAPRKMEEIVRSIFEECLDCRVQLTKQSRDGGRDLICFDSHGGKFLVEVKRYKRSHKVGIGLVQRFVGVCYIEGVRRGVFVTSSGYTLPAVDEAKRINDRRGVIRLELRDEVDLLSWLDVLGSKLRNEDIAAITNELPPRVDFPPALTQW